jgi:hypothetical protein
MSFLERASLYLADKTDAELVAMWAETRTDRLRPGTFVRYRTFIAILGDAAQAATIELKLTQAAALLKQSTDPADNVKGVLLERVHQWLGGQAADDGIDVGDVTARASFRQLGTVACTQEQIDAILAVGGEEYTWAADDGLGTDAAHFAAARTAKARLDAIAATRPATDAKLDAWEAAEVKKVTDWAAAGFAGDLAAGAEFAL